MPSKKLLDYIYIEYKTDAKSVASDVSDVVKISMKHGKKYAQNYWTSLKALESLTAMIKTYTSLGSNIDDYINLVPDEVAAELIELYEAYKIDTQYGDDVDVVKYFRRVHLVSLVEFAFAYARYHQLDEYLSLWLKLNASNTPDEAISTKADAINTFNAQCKKYNTSTDFTKECIRLMKPDFSRIKMTKDYKDRVSFLEKANKRYSIQTETKMDEVLKDIDETNRSKFR